MSTSFKKTTLRHPHSFKALQRGFSNVQIAIGILVTVILLLGAISGYQYIQQAKVNNEISALTDLRAATSSLGQAQGAFATSGDATGTLAALNFFQSSAFTVSGTAPAQTVKNQWNGDVTAAWNTNTIDFTFKGVPVSVCKDTLPKIKNIATAKVGTQNADTLANIITACGTGTTADIVYSISR